MSSVRWILAAGVAAIALTAASAGAQQKFPAVLAGHAAVPAMTLIAPPPDAPAGFRMAGKFTASDRKRVTEAGTIPTTSFIADKAAPRSSGVALPLQGQAVQGFSGIQPAGEGEFLALTDNGFGSAGNSVDALLMVHRIRPDWATGTVQLLRTIFLSDPDRKVPFHILNENTEARYLTGADFDPESIQIVGDRMFIGEEFGPYVVEFDRDGKVRAVHETVVGGKTVKAPHHYTLGLPNLPAAVSFEVRRSRGFEPMGASPDGAYLYPMFEGPIWDADAKAVESKDGREVVRILQFDVAKGAYTDKVWKYRLEENGNVVGDMDMIDAATALVIERDDASEGAAAQACAGEPKLDCFNKPAKFKRVYKIDFAQADADGFVKKVGYVDLLDIADPDKAARIGAQTDGKFVMPMLGPEGVAVLGADRIVVVNDNNLPYSSGRAIGKPDDNEIVVLRVPELLAAK